MRHVRIATYKINKGSFSDLAESAKTGLLPKFKEQPGFIRYGVADVGDQTLMSISLWKTHDEAQASVPVAANWVRDNMSDRVELRNNFIGELAFYEGLPATV
jgi:hypothetical protein